MEDATLQNLFQTFDKIKKTDERGKEYRTARELQTVLGYEQRKNFINVIEKAKISVNTSNIAVSDHFAEVGKMIDL
jgi:DNA-damage-inducible protein D